MKRHTRRTTAPLNSIAANLSISSYISVYGQHTRIFGLHLESASYSTSVSFPLQ